jgi:two-component system, OmpR family, heavy metal sensor histidine kinase CusS
VITSRRSIKPAAIFPRNAQCDLRRLQRSFEQSARFPAGASHHLKTPVAILRANVEEIRDDVDCSEGIQARAEGLLHRIHHLNSVVDNLLLLSRADAGRVELSKAEIEIREVLEGILGDALTLADPLDLTVEANIPNHLILKADPTLVGIIAQNLSKTGLNITVLAVASR